jgi:hypothetical protein
MGKFEDVMIIKLWELHKKESILKYSSSILLGTIVEKLENLN